jgi:hypothetical protein
MKKLFQRRNFFIKKELQGKLIYHSFLLAFGGVIVFAAIFCFLAADNLTISYQNQHLQIGRTPLVLLREILTAHWLFLLSVGLFITINSLFLSHRIAGPLFRLEQAFTAMRHRDLSQQVHLRNKDVGQELTDQLNLINRMISQDLRQMQLLCGEMKETLAKTGPMEEPDRLRRQTEDLQKILSSYRLCAEEK